MRKIWTCLTLVDITETGVRNGDSKQRDQQRNWETVIQTLSLKNQPIIVEGPEIVLDNINDNPSILESWFGDFYHNKEQAIWVFSFEGDRDDVYSQEQLLNDFDQVPVILGLDETAKFMLPIFHSHGSLKNIHFFL